MIEKLSEYEITSRDGGAFINVECNTKIINTLVRKINELVEFCNDIGNARSFLERHEEQITKLNDAVNELQKNATISKMETVESTENVPDLDIQLSWIGHLCRFWDYDKIESTYAILDDINVWCEHPYRKSNGNQYKHCEPVKPDDDIIYKGDNNE